MRERNTKKGGTSPVLVVLVVLMLLICFYIGSGSGMEFIRGFRVGWNSAAQSMEGETSDTAVTTADT